MCIICVKGLGAELGPKEWTWLENCWANNDDGAGMMFVTKGGKVQIIKGLMTFDKFKKAVVANGRERIGAKTVFHFRTATHGMVCQQNTHPFPLSSDDTVLGQLNVTTDFGIVHNGILPVPSDKVHSDTWLFVRDYLAPFGQLDEKVLNLVALTRDKFIILTPSALWTIGQFEKEGDWSFSNSGYKSKLAWAGWYEDGDWSQYQSKKLSCGVCKMPFEGVTTHKAESLGLGFDMEVCQWCVDEFFVDADNDDIDFRTTYLVDNRIGSFEGQEL